ncbi:tRNA (N(6)-L-threonylcarbamoyladenosine(37)-C(2))-methylthiotransferase MtaB [Minwuia sp.]|uniref:tRNA (N(6)-L-threonylcarbamoyladenosine(37)-C(2))- methylthiotransferase MtaB n=1 Tax=Minwuia sp. TaxID=2493630 RepID=UPI003A8C959C
MAGPEIVTFGCRLNTYESEVIRGHETLRDRDDIIVVNTCAVTTEAERQARQAIRKLRRERPDAEIVVTGCAAQIAPENWTAMPEVSRVVGNREKLEASAFLQGRNEPVLVEDIMRVEETAGHLIEGYDGRARAFLQVQNGCDHRCTFCIIPYGRGNSRSAPIGQVVDEARKLIARGVREIVLTGVDITSYGPDLPGRPTLGQLCRRLLAAVPGIERLRLSSIDPVEVDDDLWRLIAGEPRLMPHLHLSLQAGDDMVLKRMKRRHSRDDAIHFCARARALRPDIVFGADLIAGFPTETEEMFRNTLNIIEECDLTWLHVFPYSERPGTPAVKMPPVEKAIRRERAGILREAGTRAASRHLSAQIGQQVEVLVERDVRGHSAHFAAVKLDREAQPGDMISARGVAVEGDVLIAEAA